MIHRRINYVDPPRYSYGGSILSGAASGAATGSMFGPWGTAIGAVAGGAMGYFKENKLQSAQDEQKRKEEELIAKQQLFLNKQADRQILSQFPTYGVNQSFFKFGGKPNPQYEAEGNEVIEHSANPFEKPKTIGGKLERLSNTTSKIKGKSHAEGGIPMSGGDRIFSDRLPAPIQFLKQAKKL